MATETKNGAHFRSDAPNLQQDKYTKNQSVFNGFPIDIFTSDIQEMIISANETVGYHKDFYSGAILTAMATAIGSTNSIDTGYPSTSILWIALVGNSGDGKTHPIKNALKYFENNDKAEYDNYQSLLKEWNDTERTGNKPVFRSTVLKDFTIETIAPKLMFNPNLLIYRDELMGWINSMNKYNGGGGDTELYLELFNGGSITVERKTQEPILTPNSHINIIGGVQYKKLKNLSSGGRNDNGFMERILFIYPKDFIKPKKTFKKLPDHFNELLYRTLEHLQQQNDITFTLDIESKFEYSNWYDESNEKYPNCSTQSKLDTYFLRLLLIIDMLHKYHRKDNSSIIYESSVHSTIKLIEYFRENAKRVHSIINEGYNPLENIADNKVICYHELPKTFVISDVRDIFEKNEIRGGSIKRFINNKDLFKNTKYKHYEKKL